MDTKNVENPGEQPVSARDRLTASSMETVGSIEFDGTSINATVISTGCTTSDNFSVEQVEEAGVCRVVLMRDKPDFCRRAPFVASVAVPFELPENCENLSVVFDNPVVELADTSAKISKQR